MSDALFHERILLAEDDEDVADLLCDRLRGAGYDILWARHGAEALAMLRTAQVFLVLSDFSMPVMDGLWLCQHMRQSHPHIPFIMITAHGNSDIEIAALRLGVAGFLRKPIDFSKLLGLVQQCGENRRKTLPMASVGDHQVKVEAKPGTAPDAEFRTRAEYALATVSSKGD